MITDKKEYQSDSFVKKEEEHSTVWKKNRRRMSGVLSFDAVDDSNVNSPQMNADYLFAPARSQRNGFSKSMVDLSSYRSINRKSVMFEEDLFAHKEIIQRARHRFKELELKYPEIFKNSSKTPSVLSSSLSRQSVSSDCAELSKLKSVERKEIQTDRKSVV